MRLRVRRALSRQLDRIEGATRVTLCLLHPRESSVGDGQRTSRSYPSSQFEPLLKIARRGAQVVPLV